MKYFPMLTQVLFIGLKLGHVIDWPWWQVLIILESQLAFLLCALFIYIGASLIHNYLLKRDPNYRVRCALDEYKNFFKRK